MKRWLVAVVLVAAPARAHDPITTKLLWTQEISRLVNRHCASCHRDGGAAMSLATYDDARPWAKAIRDEVTSRRMPPWGAVKGVGEFRDDPSLSQVEIDMIVNWVEGGAPKGDDVYLPPAPHFMETHKTGVPGREVKVTTEAAVTLSAPVELAGLRPVQLTAGDSLEVRAYMPDGQVEHLIWIREWKPEWARTYYFRHAVQLPKGTTITAYSRRAAEAILLVRTR